ncbi:MAG: hypothetical protein HGA76_10790 [Candidatus Firestonebacteria bacterium]|nr:hypothetical protein [Candidatus Firestonebacteria bacterium]
MSSVRILQAARWSPEGCGRLGEAGFSYPEALPDWGHVSARPFDRFPRLDPLSKVVNILIEWLLAPQPAVGEPGFILASRYGCVEADLAYYRTAVDNPALASPQLFPYTLPSAGLAEAAIRHGLRGPAAVLLQDESLDAGLSQAQRWLETGEARRCLVLHADAVLSAGANFLQVPPRVEGWAFLLGTDEGSWAWPKPAGPGRILPRDFYAALNL